MAEEKKTTEEKIIDLIDKETLKEDESLELIEELYWADWDEINKNPDRVDRIFDFLKREDLTNKEISKMFKLYNNPHGAYVEEFSKLIVDLYYKDRASFIQSLNIEKEEVVYLIYVFRNHLVELDKDKDLEILLESDKLTREEKETGQALLKAYEHACST